MIIAGNDEDKRSRMWRRSTVISSVLIIVIAVYLLTKMFTSNPLEGTWESDDASMSLKIRSKNVLYVNMPELLGEENAEIKMSYALDMEEKTISIHADDKEIESLSEKSGGQYTKEELESAVDSVSTTFNYSVDNSRLTLTEREYGEQMTFTRK